MIDYGVVRVPGSRPVKLSPKKEKQVREQSWDNRFHLGRIPDYNAFHDRYLNPNIITSKKKKIILGVGRIRKQKDASTKNLMKSTSSNAIQKPPLVKNQILKKMKANLLSIWNQKHIPEPQRDVLLDAIGKINTKKQTSVIGKEIELLKNDKSLTQFAVRAIIAREYSIKELREFAKTTNNATNTLKHNSVESLLNLRMLSIHAVECIQAWRKNLKDIDPEISSENLKFIWENENYLVKMQSDTQFLSSTPISNFIEFANKDPFFIHACTENGKIELPVPGYLLKRIKDSESILNNEGLQLNEYIPEKYVKAKDLNESKSKLILENDKSKVSLVEISGNIEEEILKYSATVPQILQESMGKPSNAFSNALTMRYPAFLWAKINQNIIGLITLNLENQKSMQKRLYISHISAIEPEFIRNISEELVKYIWENYNCMEIRVGIISRINDQGKYEAEKSIKQYFDNLGFRWKQMIYAINEIPVQLLGLRRPENVIMNNFKDSLFDECICISYGCVIQFCKEIDDQKEADCCSAIGIACALKPLGPSSNGNFNSSR